MNKTLFSKRNGALAAVSLLMAVVMGWSGCALYPDERRALVKRDVPPALVSRMNRWQVLSIDDIIELSRRDVPPAMIIHYLFSTSAVYNIDKATLARLNAAKVDKNVIDYLLRTPAIFGPGGFGWYNQWATVTPFWWGPGWGPFFPPFSGPYVFGPNVLIVRGHHRR